MASTAAAAPLSKPFAVTFGAAPAPPGVTIPGGLPAGVTIPSFTLTLRNDTGTQQLGSADITVPATFRIGSTPAPQTSRGELLAPLGNTLRLRNAALPPGGSLTITLSLGVPCVTPTDPATYRWIVLPKQSNDFKGTGNDLTQPAPATLDNTVTGRCALRFAADGQPKKAVKNQPIRAIDFAPPSSSAAVAVEAVDGRSPALAQRLIGVPGPEITVAQGTPPTVRLVPSSTPVTADAGVARFPVLSITAAGVYTLRASTTDTRFATSASSPASSDSFTIVDVRADCNAASCRAALGPADAPTTTITGATSTATGFIELSQNLGREPVCAGYTPPTGSAWYEFDFTAERAKTVAINYTAAQMKTVANKAALQVCYAAPTPFVAKSGPAPFDYDGNAATGTDGKEGFVGLLPECPATPTALCVLGRDPIGAGGVSISFFAPSGSGDPRYH